MEIYILFGIQLLIGAGLAGFYLKQARRIEILEERLALVRRALQVQQPAPATSSGPIRQPDRALAEPPTPGVAPIPRDPRPAAAPLELSQRLDQHWVHQAYAQAAEIDAQPTSHKEAESMDRIIQLAQAGRDTADIARATGRGRGEVELLLQLYRLDRRAAGTAQTARNGR